MSANQDFKDLLSALNAESVEYLIVGAHAVIAYTEPRFTKDLDILVRPSPANVHKVYSALMRFGAPLRKIKAEDFLDNDLVYQIGIAPNRIDILTSVAGVTFDEALADSRRIDYDGVPVLIMGRATLIRAKKATNRPQDRLDVEKMENF
ncbi:MAG: hypothetical protein Q7J98_00200 [Kiritimatiellia bacterium]|nr:hypothetical protein [Kiritimatiellia bacterium]